MATSDDFVSSALRKIGVKGAETPLTATELSDGREVLNDLGAQLEAEGFELGFTTLTTGSDTVTIPAYANNFYKIQLAAQLLNEYQEPLPQLLADTAQSSRATVVRELNRRSIGQAGTYQNLIAGAFELSGVKGGSQPINSVEVQNALPRLNDIITEYEGRGFYLGYNINTGTDLTGQTGMPDWVNAWIKAELAIRLSVSYSVPPNEVAAKMARDGLETAYNRFTDAPQVQFSDTLPLGAGRHHLNREFAINNAQNQIQLGQGGILSDDEGQPLLQDFKDNDA